MYSKRTPVCYPVTYQPRVQDLSTNATAGVAIFLVRLHSCLPLSGSRLLGAVIGKQTSEVEKMAADETDQGICLCSDRQHAQGLPSNPSTTQSKAYRFRQRP